MLFFSAARPPTWLWSFSNHHAATWPAPGRLHNDISLSTPRRGAGLGRLQPHESDTQPTDTRRKNYDPCPLHHVPKQWLHSLRGSSVKIGTIQRGSAWPLWKDDMHKSRSANHSVPSAHVRWGADMEHYIGHAKACCGLSRCMKARWRCARSPRIELPTKRACVTATAQCVP